MPHIIIEYAHDCVSENDLTSLLDDVHRAVIETRLFAVDNLKTRAIPVHHYQIGQSQSGFVHTQLRIHPGRSQEQKSALTKAVLNAKKTWIHSPCVMTVEVTDMDKSSYAKEIK